MPILLLGCTTTDKYDLFSINTSDNYQILQFNKIGDIKTFNEIYWKADSADKDFYFVAKFDFKKGDFSNNADKGIRIEGLPFSCLVYDCARRNRLGLYLSDNYEILDDNLEKLNDQQAKDLIKKNILNYGKDPEFSDEPRHAVTEVFLFDYHQISKTGHVLKLIVDSYLELIEGEKLETRKITDQLFVEFPPTIYLRQHIVRPTKRPAINDDEITGDIEIDTAILGGK